MIEEVFADIYLNKIPLEGSPLKELNSYIVMSGERPLIIDLGLDRPECRRALLDGLEELNVDVSRTDVFLTHKHSDHSGLANFMTGMGARIFMSGQDCGSFNRSVFPEIRKVVHDHILNYSIDKYIEDTDKLMEFVSNPKRIIDFIPVEEGFCLNAGCLNFTVVSFPGHTPGLCGLYEKDRRILFCGDHILGKITPNICFISRDTDILGMYLKSLEKASLMDVDILFTSHRENPHNHKDRVADIYAHHIARLKEIECVISSDWLTVNDVASRISWNIRSKNWDEFPPIQKFFAASEAAAHLEHLRHKARVEGKLEDGRFYYKS